MPASAAMIREVVTTTPDETVQKAWDKLRKDRYHVLPVVDKKGKYVGVLNTSILVQKIIPASATLPRGLQNLGFLHQAHNYSAKKWNKVKKMKVKEIMAGPESFTILHPDTSLLECLRLLMLEKTPLVVVEEETEKLVGILSIHAVFDVLESNIEELKKQKLID